MSFLTTLGHLLVPQREDYRELSSNVSEELQLEITKLRQMVPPRSYRLPSVEEAMGVPAIHGAVSLIANTVGSLSLEVFQNGNLISDPFRIPRITLRPNPLSKPYDFFRDTAWYLATRGEFWWWVAARDSDGLAAALYPVPPWEIRVENNLSDRLRPRILWGQTEVNRSDLIYHRYLPDDANPHRGKGPLQRGLAAVSVAVEADAWAGNFFSGSLPSVVGSTEQDLGESDLLMFDQQWMEKDNNLPRWMTNGMHLTEPPYNAQKAQLTESRQHQVGEVARLFNMPGSLLEYNMPGASLRYQNDEQVWTDFQRRCLTPDYLEPMEQAIGDLLVRSMSTRFNLDQLLRSDSKTRAEVYEKLVPIGVISADEARQREGYEPGNINFAPVPAAQPSTVPNRLPVNLSDDEPLMLQEVRCPSCERVLGEFSGAYSLKCRKCMTQVNGTVGGPRQLMQADDPVQPQQPIVVYVQAPDNTQLADAFKALSMQSKDPTVVNVNVPETPVNVQNISPEAMKPVQDILAAAKDSMQMAQVSQAERDSEFAQRMEDKVSDIKEAVKRPREVTVERGPDHLVSKAIIS